jgi:hypothetical protein
MENTTNDKLLNIEYKKDEIVKHFRNNKWVSAIIVKAYIEEDDEPFYIINLDVTQKTSDKEKHTIGSRLQKINKKYKKYKIK